MRKCEGCGGQLARVEAVAGPRDTCNNQQCPEYKNYLVPLCAVCKRGITRTNPEWDNGKGCSLCTEQVAEPARGHGIKLDTGKPLVYAEFLMQFPRAIRLVARVGEAGSSAPGHVRSGWKAVDRGYERYSEALARHVLLEAILATEVEPTSPDPDHDLLWEAATVAWNALARLEHLIKQNPGAAERLDGDPLA